MNRRGFFEALAGGIVAATGLRSLVRLPAVRLSGHAYGVRVGAWFKPGDVILLKGQSICKTEATAQSVDAIISSPTIAPWRTTPAPWLAPAFPAAFDTTGASAPTAPIEPPSVWPDHHGAIDATAELSPVAQMKRLVDLFSSSGEASPAFVEALIGELVLTRVRLAAADPRALCSFDPVAA